MRVDYRRDNLYPAVQRRSVCRTLLILLICCGTPLLALGQAEDSRLSSTSKLLVDARTRLGEKGFKISGFWQNDYFGDPTVGKTEGFTGTGDWSRIRGSLDIDMGKLARAHGLSLHITSTLNQGLDVIGDSRYMDSLIGNGNDSLNHQLRLDSWWVRQEIYEGKVIVSAGQISGFDFFGYVPQDFSHFVTLGPFYAPFALYNTYSSADPMTTPAVLLRIKPSKHFYYRTMLQSITEGNPRDPKAVLGFYNWYNNPSGTSMQIKDGAVWHNEVACLYSPGQVHFGVSYSGARAFTQWSGKASDATLVTSPAFTKNSGAGNENFYWIVKQAVYRPTSGANRGIDVGATFVDGPANKGVLPYNRQIVTTVEFNGLLPKRPGDSANFSFNDASIRGPLRTATFQSERVYELDYSFQVTPWLHWMPDWQLHQNLAANPKNGTGLAAGFRSLITF